MMSYHSSPPPHTTSLTRNVKAGLPPSFLSSMSVPTAIGSFALVTLHPFVNTSCLVLLQKLNKKLTKIRKTEKMIRQRPSCVCKLRPNKVRIFDNRGGTANMTRQGTAKLPFPFPVRANHSSMILFHIKWCHYINIHIICSLESRRTS